MRAFHDRAVAQALRILAAALSFGLAAILTLYHFGASLWLAVVIGALVGLVSAIAFWRLHRTNNRSALRWWMK